MTTLQGETLRHFYPQTGQAITPLGDGFIKMIKLITAPIIFCTAVVGIAGMDHMKKVGKTSGLALLSLHVPGWPYASRVLTAPTETNMKTASMQTRRWVIGGLATVIAALLAGCAATAQVDAQWVDPQFKGRSFAGQRVLVVCHAGDQSTLRRLCEDQLAAEVIATGGAVSRLPDGAAVLNDATAYLPAARSAKALAVLRGVVTPAARSYNAGPQFSFGIGGFGGGSSSVGGGVGITLPAGAGSVNTGYSIDLGITDVASGRLVWSAKTSTPPSQDVGTQMLDLARTSMAAARSAGVI